MLACQARAERRRKPVDGTTRRAVWSKAFCLTKVRRAANRMGPGCSIISSLPLFFFLLSFSLVFFFETAQAMCCCGSGVACYRVCSHQLRTSDRDMLKEKVDSEFCLLMHHLWYSETARHKHKSTASERPTKQRARHRSAYLGLYMMSLSAILSCRLNCGKEPFN